MIRIHRKGRKRLRGSRYLPIGMIYVSPRNLLWERCIFDDVPKCGPDVPRKKIIEAWEKAKASIRAWGGTVIERTIPTR